MNTITKMKMHKEKSTVDEMIQKRFSELEDRGGDPCHKTEKRKEMFFNETV